ncbi:NUDIX domain-containing protein [Croceibacterium sp. LX-88]|uniref:NUDIX domain-containing protein n=1 Tax=Croceibacterium selenioxidans TaxID=2838833 RepID=A0ABS5W0U9_9SPHN|nr:NUDIX domain-containing protein [Croceibacterium selenioxidans]MBT2132717.1 NUDIX domain-containing protein [Croceibacterium selenioxidans]
MLHLIPAPLHRQLYRVADGLRKRWWVISRPRRTSVVVLAFDEQGRVLLVRHSYGLRVWSAPGGGMGEQEDPALAAAREFREELSCELSNLTLLEARELDISGSRDTVHLFAARLNGTPRPDMREIVEVGLFDPAHLPADCARLVPSHVELAVTALKSGALKSEQR